MSKHEMAGRIVGATYTVSFCECGLGFCGFINFPTEEGRSTAISKADRKLNIHIEVSRETERT